jgi:hypothetical protein
MGIDTHFTRLGVVFPRYPPLLLDLQMVLKVQQQVRRRHRPTGEEMSTHPAFLEIIRSHVMCKYVYKELASGFQSSRDLRHKKLVVLHMLEEFNRDHAVKGRLLEFMIDDVSRNHLEILQGFPLHLVLYVLSLGLGIREGRNLRIWKDLSKVESTRAPSAAVFRQHTFELRRRR